MEAATLETYNGILTIAVGLFLAVVLKRHSDKPKAANFRVTEQVMDCLVLAAAFLASLLCLKAYFMMSAGDSPSPGGTVFLYLVVIFAISGTFSNFVLHVTHDVNVAQASKAKRRDIAKMPPRALILLTLGVAVLFTLAGLWAVW